MISIGVFNILMPVIMTGALAFMFYCMIGKDYLGNCYNFWGIEYDPKEKAFRVTSRFFFLSGRATYREFKTRDDAIEWAEKEIKERLQTEKDNAIAKARASAEGFTRIDAGAVERRFLMSQDQKELARLAAQYNFPLPKINLAE